MAITLELIEKNFTQILDKTGYQSYVPWEQFTKTSTTVVNSIDSLTKWLGIFRQMQHKNFIQTMKRLKSLDIPDSIESVRKKKLPKQVLKPIIPRFKLQNDIIQLVDTKESLKEQALKQYNIYKSQNQQLVSQFQKYIEFLSAKAMEAGFKQSQPVPDLKPFKSTMQFKFDQKKFKQISESIKVSYLSGTKWIDGNTYNQIVDKTFDSVSDIYVNLVKTSRKQQRKNMANHKTYFELINSFLNNSESLIVEAQRKIYHSLGFDPAKWQQNEQVLLQKGMGQLLMMSQTGLRQKIKKSIPSTKQVSIQQAVQVIKYQIKCIRQRSGQIRSILSEMPKGIESAQIVPVLLSLILNDFIYDAFGFQEEDFMKNMNGMILFTNPELAEVFGQMEHEILKLMQQLGIIPQDISNLMMGPQGEQMAQMMAQMGGMGFDPTAMQQGGNSQNPFDMLQAQQMAQFQQMMFPPKQDKKQPPK